MPDDYQSAEFEESVDNQDALATDANAQRLVRQAKPFLDLATEAEASREEPSPTTRPFQFEEFSSGVRRLEIDSAIEAGSPIRLDVELGRTQIEPGEFTKLATGSLVSLNSLANEPVDIFALGRLVARAEVVTVDSTPSLRIVEVL